MESRRVSKAAQKGQSSSNTFRTDRWGPPLDYRRRDGRFVEACSAAHYRQEIWFDGKKSSQNE